MPEQEFVSKTFKYLPCLLKANDLYHKRGKYNAETTRISAIKQILHVVCILAFCIILVSKEQLLLDVRASAIYSFYRKNHLQNINISLEATCQCQTKYDNKCIKAKFLTDNF